MEYNIKCDQANEWNIDICINCKNFRSGQSVKNRWRCKLNSDAEGRTAFHLICAENYLISAGIQKEKQRNKVEVQYVGKRKRQSK